MFVNLEHEDVISPAMPLAQARAAISAGGYVATDRAWFSGMAQWQEIKDIPELAGSLTLAAIPAGSVRTQNSLKLAGFWRRGAAWCVDALLYAVILVLLVASVGRALIMVGFNFNRFPNLPETLLWPAVFGVAGLLGVLMPAALLAAGSVSPWQASPGKRLLALRLTGESAGGGVESLPFLRAFAREALKLLGTWLFFITFLPQPFGTKRQGLHDMICRTQVNYSGGGLPAWLVWVVLSVGGVSMFALTGFGFGLL
jgi:hypothetical protein